MKRRSKEEMYAMVEQYEKSEINQQEFCDQQGIKKGTFAYWIGKHRKEKGEGLGSFIPIKLDSVNKGSYILEVETRKGSYFRFNTLVPTEYLSKIMGL